VIASSADVAVSIPNSNGLFLTSADGVTWTERSFPAHAGSQRWTSLAFGKDRFVAVGDGGALMYSDPIPPAARLSISHDQIFLNHGQGTVEKSVDLIHWVEDGVVQEGQPRDVSTTSEAHAFYRCRNQ
jgi:hypothetical protein